MAIKVIRASVPGHVHARERFRREARAAAQLRHPNVASVFHFGETPAGECFYAMEFIEGETLAAKVKREGPLPAPLVVEIALQVTAALIAADERGLVHRDLKPANLMLATPVARAAVDPRVHRRRRPVGYGQGDRFRTWPKRLTAAANDSSWRRRSPRRAASWERPPTRVPEQAEGGDVDARSDIYSLGVTLWYLLTGRCLSRAAPSAKSTTAKSTAPLPVAQLNDSRVPAPLVALLKSMLAADPGEAARLARRAAARRWNIAAERMDGGAAPASRPARGAGGRSPGNAACRRCALVLLLAGAAGYSWTRQSPHPAPVCGCSRRRGVAAATKASPCCRWRISPRTGPTRYFADGIQDDLLNSLAQDQGIEGHQPLLGHGLPQHRHAQPARDRPATRRGHHAGRQRAPRARPGASSNVALIDVRDGRQLWAERYDRTLADALTLQGELATEIANALHATLSPDGKGARGGPAHRQRRRLRALPARPRLPDAAHRLVAGLPDGGTSLPSGARAGPRVRPRPRAFVASPGVHLQELSAHRRNSRPRLRRGGRGVAAAARFRARATSRTPFVSTGPRTTTSRRCANWRSPPA